MPLTTWGAKPPEPRGPSRGLHCHGGPAWAPGMPAGVWSLKRVPRCGFSPQLQRPGQPRVSQILCGPARHPVTAGDRSQPTPRNYPGEASWQQPGWKSGRSLWPAIVHLELPWPSAACPPSPRHRLPLLTPHPCLPLLTSTPTPILTNSPHHLTTPHASPHPVLTPPPPYPSSSLPQLWVPPHPSAPCPIYACPFTPRPCPPHPHSSVPCLCTCPGFGEGRRCVVMKPGHHFTPPSLAGILLLF